MPQIPVNTEQAAATLKQAATTLKATLVVAAAAILSQAQSDLEANAAAAEKHLDALGARLHGLREQVLKANAVAAAVIAQTGTARIDTDALDARIAAVDAGIEDARAALYAVVRSDQRNGLDAFADRAGALGRALQAVMVLIGGPSALDTPPFQFDQFFLESMQDLGQRDWSEAAGI